VDESSGDKRGVPRSCRELILSLAQQIEDLRSQPVASTMEGSNRLEVLARHVLDILASLDAERIINVLSWENEGMFTLPVPLDLPGGMVLGHILIHDEEGHRPAEKRGGNARAVLHLCLDALGEVAIEVGMKAEKVICRIQCETDEIRRFIALCLGELDDRFQAAGLDVDWLECTVGQDLVGRRERSLRERLAVVRDEVNFSV